MVRLLWPGGGQGRPYPGGGQGRPYPTGSQQYSSEHTVERLSETWTALSAAPLGLISVGQTWTVPCRAWSLAVHVLRDERANRLGCFLVLDQVGDFVTTLKGDVSASLAKPALHVLIDDRRHLVVGLTNHVQRRQRARLRIQERDKRVLRLIWGWRLRLRLRLRLGLRLRLRLRLPTP